MQSYSTSLISVCPCISLRVTMLYKYHINHPFIFPPNIKRINLTRIISTIKNAPLIPKIFIQVQAI